ncbi:aspartate racemase [Reinekea marinisedimentorum]|uniref:Aspartate racemase n=2 Tax=Reinekea marinisedimentorum TaxID=230495 RepID=A0A4R3IAZ3_9GAMM|nr:aspartate racemase [Reinekea marinisedimentorum]
MSWESSGHYYQLINERVKQQLGGLHSADILMRSVDFAIIEQMQRKGDWQAAGDYLAECAAGLKLGGAEGLVIATNTMHKVADRVEQASGLELIHIADCTGAVLKQHGVTTVGLLGTAFTMEQDFYKQRLAEKFDLEVLVPGESERQEVHAIIYNELCLGKTLASSRQRYIEITEALAGQGAEAVILGCTEIGMLLSDDVTDVPLVDTTQVHAQQAAEWMLGNR